MKDRRFWAQEENPESENPEERKPSHVEALEAEIADLNRRLRAMAEQIRGTSNEVEQVKARVEREAKREIERRVRDVLISLIPTVDDLDRAIANAGTEQGPLLAGIVLVRQSFLSRLEAYGVSRIEPLDEPFDPKLHEAIATVPVGPERNNVVTATFAPGYLVGEEVLRAAKVSVGKAVQ